MSSVTATLDKIVSLCKRRGLVYPSSDIYGGLNGIYDFGPVGTLLKQNIRSLWQQSLEQTDKKVLFIEGALIGSYEMWKASGHVDNFHDPMVDCVNCKKRFRADEFDLKNPCPSCGKLAWTEVRQFNMMFSTQVGASCDNAITAYLRPETAQAIFVNFKNVMSTNRVKIPFGIAQIGKAFRNEITPKQFLFRMREFEQMEIEWFCTADRAEEFFEFWQSNQFSFFANLGINRSKLRLRPHASDELAHYSTKCTDVEYEFPFGWKELQGIAHRGNFDLTQHSHHSGKDLSIFDDETKASYTPTVIECSVGVDRLFLTLLFDAYHEDTVDGEERITLKLHPRIAPVKAAFLPLVKKLSEPMSNIYRDIKKVVPHIEFDETGSIGKRYRRYDEIGTPVCFTFDFDSLQDNMVTVRNRDTLQQERINISSITSYLLDMLK